MNVEHDRKKFLSSTFQTRGINVQVEAVLLLGRAILKIAQQQRHKPSILARLRTNALITQRIKSSRKRRLCDRARKPQIPNGWLSIRDTEKAESVLVTPALDGACGSGDFDLTGCVLEEEDATEDRVEADGGKLGGAGNPVCLAGVFVHCQAVREYAGNT